MKGRYCGHGYLLELKNADVSYCFERTKFLDKIV